MNFLVFHFNRLLLIQLIMKFSWVWVLCIMRNMRRQWVLLVLRLWVKGQRLFLMKLETCLYLHVSNACSTLVNYILLLVTYYLLVNSKSTKWKHFFSGEYFKPFMDGMENESHSAVSFYKFVYKFYDVCLSLLKFS